MKIKVIVASAVLLVCGATAPAQELSTTNSTCQNWGFAYDPNELYRPYELSLDAFAIGTARENSLQHFSGDRIRRHGELGAGAGLEFFFNRYIGLEGEGYSENIDHTFVNDAGGNIILRYPIGETGFAPYIYGGGGHQFYPSDAAYWDAGPGLEYRFTKWFGIFADARFVATHHTGNYGLARLGVSFRFW